MALLVIIPQDRLLDWQTLALLIDIVIHESDGLEGGVAVFVRIREGLVEQTRYNLNVDA